jgi:hypothetical protein
MEKCWDPDPGWKNVRIRIRDGKMFGSGIEKSATLPLCDSYFTKFTYRNLSTCCKGGINNYSKHEDIYQFKSAGI